MVRKHATLIQTPLIIIVSLLGFLALGGLLGGYAILVDTSGELLGLPTDLIDEIPLLNNYLILGLIILLFFGLAPVIAIYGLIVFNRNMQRRQANSAYHWSWRAARMISLILRLWMVIQAIIIGFSHGIQIAFGICGLLIYALLSTASVRRVYFLNNT